MINWNHETQLNAKMLDGIDRSHIDSRLAEGDEDLAALIQRHNGEWPQLEARFERLAQNRAAKELLLDNLLLTTSASIRELHVRMIDESWDALVAMRKWVASRHAVLTQLVKHLDKRFEDQQRLADRTVEGVRRVLVREHRQYIKSYAGRGEAHVMALADEDAAVLATNQQLTDLKVAMDRMVDLQRKISDSNRAIETRQKECLDRLLR